MTNNFDINGWRGWCHCGCPSCTTPGKDPAQGIISPNDDEFEWGDGISRSGDEEAIAFIMNWFSCNEDKARSIMDEIQGQPQHTPEDWW